MNTGRNDLLPVCRRLLAWAQTTGGWDAPVWEELRAAVERDTPMQRPPPRSGDRVLRLRIDGTLDIRIPDEIDEYGANWDDWLDRAVQAALTDGRWLECTAVSGSDIGVLDDDGHVHAVPRRRPNA